MTLLRIFIAIEIPAEIKNAIAIQTSSLRQRAGNLVRWVTPENTHLTIKFLGDIKPEGLEPLAQAIQAVCRQQAAFEINVSGSGCFPNLRQPRIIWVGLNAPPDLGLLHGQIEAAMLPLGHAVEARSFSAHLTIGRVREPLKPADLALLRSALAEQNSGELGTFSVCSLTLFKSELRPGGPLYTPLFNARMGN